MNVATAIYNEVLLFFYSYREATEKQSSAVGEVSAGYPWSVVV